MQKITALLLTLMVTILSTGCGFQLMRTKPIKETYPEIAFVGDKRNVFYKRLFEKLTVKGINVIEANNDFQSYLAQDIPVLTCSSLNNNISTLSVSGNSQDLEYNIRSSVSCLLYLKDKKPYTIKSAINRSYLNKAGSTITSDSEKSALINESIEELTTQITFRLRNSYLVQFANIPDSEENQIDEFKVVFNATDANGNTKEYRISEKDLELLNKANAQELLENNPAKDVNNNDKSAKKE